MVCKISIFFALIVAFQPLSNLNAPGKKQMDHMVVLSLVILSQMVNTFLVLTYDSIYISTDNGMNWKGVNSNLPQNAPGFVTVSSLGSNRGSMFAGTFAGVYRSTNNGESWESINGDHGP
jgi:hypothetical protein